MLGYFFPMFAQVGGYFLFKLRQPRPLSCWIPVNTITALGKGVQPSEVISSRVHLVTEPQSWKLVGAEMKGKKSDWRKAGRKESGKK